MREFCVFIHRISRLAVLLLLVFYHSVSSASYCLEEWACWEVKEVSGRFEFWVKNQKPFPFTSTIDVKTQNLREGDLKKDRYSETTVIQGLSQQRVLTLYPVNPERKVTYRDIFYWTPGVMDAVHDDDVLYQLPFAAGESYPLVQGFGGGWSHRGGSKYAVDFAMPVGTPVHAARDGTVVQAVAHHTRGGASRRFIEFANYIVVLHSDGTTGEYHHLMRDGIEVEVGDAVRSGDLLGYSGNTGFSSLPHLHFAVYRPKAFGDFESIPFQFMGGAQTRRHWKVLE